MNTNLCSVAANRSSAPANSMGSISKRVHQLVSERFFTAALSDLGDQDTSPEEEEEVRDCISFQRHFQHRATEGMKKRQGQRLSDSESDLKFYCHHESEQTFVLQRQVQPKTFRSEDLLANCNQEKMKIKNSKDVDQDPQYFIQDSRSGNHLRTQDLHQRSFHQWENHMSERSQQQSTPHDEVMRRLHSLKDEGSFNDYLEEFAKLTFPVKRITTVYNEGFIYDLLMDLFISGLKEDNQRYVLQLNPSKLFDAMELAEYYEEVVKYERSVEGEDEGYDSQDDEYVECTDYEEEHPSLIPNLSEPSLKSSSQLSCKASPTDAKSFFKDEKEDRLLQLMQNLYLGNSEGTQEDGVCPTNSTIKLYLGKPLLGMGVEAASRKLMVHQVISLPRPRPPEPPPRTYLQLLKDVQHFIKQLELTNGNDHEVKLKRSRETSSKSMSEEVVGNPRPPPKPPWLATKRFTCWKLAEIMNFINELWQRMEKLRLPFNKQVVGVFTLSTEGAKSQRQQEGKASRTQRKEEIVKGIISNNCKAQPMKAIDQKNVQQVGFNIKGPACNATIDEEEKKQGNTAANSWVCLSAMDFLGTRRAASDEEED